MEDDYKVNVELNFIFNEIQLEPTEIDNSKAKV